ncbi:uncharacterized protein L203_105920 [Cryptococcus depauperatus CBS 7841]|uniref:Tyrosine specific protein phosphatases domain-containing protein n=1 Tax=Cryptococcus depauperatus CBS 7841 TaxID=1295531 RepID=A0A1E3HJ29_9TREE|nr:hypothetical protein L203_06433 [Cryptococcus depauperatus CBS 7841]
MQQQCQESLPLTQALQLSEAVGATFFDVPNIAQISASSDLLSKHQEVLHEEWRVAQTRRVYECARLCSQWPQSGYNLMKHGPRGAAIYYQPQSFCNPHHVANVMNRQAELERYLCTTSGTFFSCRRPSLSRVQHRSQSRSSDDDEDGTETEHSLSSEKGNSPMSSIILDPSPEEEKTARDLREAMASSLIAVESGESPKILKSLDELANGMALVEKNSEDFLDGDQVDLDGNHIHSRQEGRAQCCGAKRQCVLQGYDEEKRRKVDETMVVEEIELGVSMPTTSLTTSIPNFKPPTRGRKYKMSSSVPDMTEADAVVPVPAAIFGMMVKTSESHPIIISPFFPVELLPILSQHLVMPQSTKSFSKKPLLLDSRIDVPSLLLSFAPPQSPQPSVIPSPIQPAFCTAQFAEQRTVRQIPSIGNLLLSSCPGKRLRLDGPSKRRGPVCRDLIKDLKRIKNEGVGCVVCCLDNEELALLGVPWDNYRDVAAEIGLDVIRLPMPDGFTPVSIELFDAQVTLIVTRYSLQGVNVLVHCRGGVGRAGITACAWAIKMGFVQPHPSLAIVEEASRRRSSTFNNSSSSISSATSAPPAELEHQIVMSIVERVIAMIRCRRGLKAIESYEQVQFLARYVASLRENARKAN